MKITFSEFRTCVGKACVYLPYSFLLDQLIYSGKLEKLGHFPMSDNSTFEYNGGDLTKDLHELRKNYYVVSSFSENLPNGWLRFNDIIADLSRQCTDNISFYVPYYDLNLSSYFTDLSELKIKKNITLYPPEKEYRRAEPEKALKKLKEIGFKYRFSPPGIHAKIYLFDDQAALIGSFNFTENAAYINKELGVLFFGEQIKTLRRFMETKA
jgi:hypothetical protein